MIVASAFSTCDLISTRPCCMSEPLTIVALCEAELWCILFGAIGSPFNVGSLFDTGVRRVCVICEDYN